MPDRYEQRCEFNSMPQEQIVELELSDIELAYFYKKALLYFETEVIAAPQGLSINNTSVNFMFRSRKAAG